MPFSAPCGARFGLGLASQSLIALSLAVGLLSISVPATAAIPSFALVEGTLATSGGGPAADGNYSVKISLYKDAVGGAPLWSEQATLDVKNGQFQHSLGSAAQIAQSVLQQAAHIGLAVASDPELPRKPLHSVLYAARAAFAESVICSGCIAVGSLDPAIQSDLKNAVKSNELADVAKSGAYADLLGAPNVAGFVKASDLKKVATTGSFADLTDVPVAVKVNTACGTNLVVKGIKADGSLDCAAGGAGSLPPDGIDDVSNGIIWNTFSDTVSGKKDIPIPDFAGPGVTDTLDFPDIGSCQKIWLVLDVANSDMTSIKVELYGPNMSSPYVIYNGGKGGNTLVGKFNDDTPILTGDMNKDWLGKNIKGLWSITVRDLNDNTPQNIDGKFNWTMSILTLSNKKIQIKGDLIVDGKITSGSGSSIESIVDFNLCTPAIKGGPCVASFTGAKTFLEAAKFCASIKADLCTDSQSFAARRQSIWAMQPNWTNSFADNDGGQWSINNGGTGDNHSDTTFYVSPCCYNITPTQPGEQQVAGVRVLKVNNSADKTWAEAIDACLALQSDLCDKGQYYVLRSQGIVTATMWASDHSDNDGNVASSAIGNTSDDTSPGEKYGYACCATNRTTNTCPAPNTEVSGVCVAKVFNSNSFAFTTAAASCASMGARICSISQSAVLRAAGTLSCPGNWSGSHSDNDGNQASVGIGNASDSPPDSQALGYACCF